MFDEPINVTDEAFENTVIDSDLPVIVDFWAVLCMPCKAIAPILENLAEEYQGKVKVTKLDVDNNPETGSKYGIRSIPTLILFKNGEEIDKIVGAGPKDTYIKMIEKHL